MTLMELGKRLRLHTAKNATSKEPGKINTGVNNYTEFPASNSAPGGREQLIPLRWMHGPRETYKVAILSHMFVRANDVPSKGLDHQ